ncbi:MAG: hypothetical protein NUV82_04320 [Candidatus Komeilibacteria bacterium]|nr:hypothetical protein [Candidatus Komeilibacteria bacterium]
MPEDIKKPMDHGAGEDRLNKPSRSNTEANSMVAKIITIVIIVVVLLGALYFVDKYTSVNIFGMEGEQVTVTDWSAVFLSNGQVYFGKVESYNSNFVTLSDIYYLQVVQRPLQQTQTGETEQAQGQNELSLVKLGNELHGPEDYMKINADHVLFTERLKSDSQVVDAISRYKTEQAGQ